MSALTVDITLNGDALSTAVPEVMVLDVSRPLVGDRRHELVAIPGRAGSWRFDEEPGDRVIEIMIDIAADSFAERRAAVRALAYWADVQTSARLIISDEPDRFHDALLDNAAEVEERLRYGACALRFLVGPYAQMIAASSESESATTNPDSDTFAISDTVTAEPVVELTPSGGTLTSFALTVNGYQLTWSGLVGAGDTITISSLSDTVTLGENDDVNLTGTFDVNDLDMADVAGEFPLLFGGSNTWTLSWTGTATSVALEFTWRERIR